MKEPGKDFTLAHRNSSIPAFIDESHSRLKEILKRLEWNIEPVSWYMHICRALNIFTYIHFIFFFRTYPRILL